jgi:predicted DNA-binding transcriptional regulator YafY
MGERTLSRAARLNKLAELLQIRTWGVGELAARFDCGLRTVERDLRTLRKMGENIESQARGRYSLTRPHEVKVHFTSVEAKAVYMALRLFALHSSEYNEHYRVAVEKLARALPEPAAEGAIAALDRLRGQPNSLRSKIAEDVARAWLERRRLEFTYRRAFGSEPRHYRFDVYMVEVSPYYFNTYAIGVNHAHEGHQGKTLVLRLDRMSETRLTEEPFEVDPAFDPKAFLASAWGVMTGEPEAVHLHFDAEVAREVQSRTWHPSQALQQNPDGSVILKLLINESMELTRWIRGWGPYCEVLLPDKLRKVVKQGWRPAPREQEALLAAEPPDGSEGA